MKRLLLSSALLAASALVAPNALAQDAKDPNTVEVLHWWTSGGEAAALNVLKEDLKSKGIDWVDMPIAGGGGSDAMTVLRARVTAGNPPTAVQMLGFDITDWAEQGSLADLASVADEGKWDDVIPKALQKFAKHDDKWVAAPVNIHSTNWVWANKALLDEMGIAQPTNWEELVAAMQKVKDGGKTALAHGGQPWQDATIFDSVVLGVGGPEFYKKAFIDLDPDALGGDQMVEAFKRMKTLRGFVDDNFSGRDWNLASAMVINGEAAFQIMGDWAKGEFLKAKKVPGKDFLCFRVPGTQGSVTFNSDEFAMFKVGEDKAKAQGIMATAVMDPKFQSAFNVVKGSVPARTDVPDTDFDDCGKQGMKDVAEADSKGTLMGSMAHGHANPANIKNAIYDVVTAQFNGETSPEEAAKQLVEAVQNAQ